MSQAAPLSLANKTEKSCGKEDIKEYIELSKLLKNEKFIRRNLKDLQTRAKCPFKVLYFNGFTRVMCDFSECTRDNSCDKHCKQAYMKAADIIPNECSNKAQVTHDVEMGCIYVPKQSNHSKETHGPKIAE
jgi:hypothetical protein